MPDNKKAAVHPQTVKEFGVKPVQSIVLQTSCAKPWLCMFLLASLLTGCAGTSGKAPVVDRSHAAKAKQRQANPVTSGQYIVQRGDTLYSIAFRFGWDWKVLAARNGVRAPYTIIPGQTIRFSNLSRATTVAKTPVITSVKKPVVLAPVTPVSVPKQEQRVTVSKQTSSPVSASAQGKWLWPATGALIGRFSSNTSLNKGIDIAGKLGEPIVATADGSVVYAGSGLRGYGELVIIKHNDTFISAYGHNRRLLVNEGQQVKAGQRIAEMGSTGTDRVKVHFEIRRQGKPVDPLQYLPKQ
jgi:lipoprotein NlpD